jgi:hypothetical protein
METKGSLIVEKLAWAANFIFCKVLNGGGKRINE